ncbi:hypothetical protein N7474_002848 [Penicillium riverlandense]|uniref:uncharacterized protein n=1 Tax=Penicillium riverlandense TaxID=1903569 RepID=UPI0025495CC1|nr:uncharacterized protein N7474_002848 [Penicillium riverlandense]KAJ5825710.1 hypothetical protein N7474_002848 [Penicillium riverlandense]
MEIVSSAASVVAVIQLAGSVVKSCGGYIKQVKDAPKEIKSLQEELDDLLKLREELSKLLENTQDTTLSTPERVRNRLLKCYKVLETLKDKIDPGNSKKAMSRMGLRALKWPLKSAEAKRAIKDIERCKLSLNSALLIGQTTHLADIARATARNNRNEDLERLPLVVEAVLDSCMDQHEDKCLSGTRTELLLQITDWAKSTAPKDKCIFWLKGMAGTGKSTISRTVAESFRKDNSLGASFFFKRGEGDRGNTAKLFPTLVRQLVIRLPHLVPSVQKAIQIDPSIATKSLREQFGKLLLEPFRSLGPSDTQNIVIVIDALDECEHDDDIRVILQLLPHLQEANGIRLRIFLTTRLDPLTNCIFSKMPSHSYQDLALHEIPEEVTKDDIALFLNSRLLQIRVERSLPIDWPGDTNIQTLIAMSVPLFIFAATICRMFQDRQLDPVDTLKEILEHRSEGSQLNGTYLPVLNRVLKNQSEKRKQQIIQEFQEIVGTIVMLETPLSIISLAKLIGVSERAIDLRLDSFHSVISIPQDRTMPVRLFHLSFRDFLLDPETRKHTPLWVNEKAVHQNLATRCLSVCQNLRRNICELPSDATLHADIEPQRIHDHIPPELQYACRFWAYHLAKSEDPALVNIFSFLENNFLHWLEAMGILGLGAEVVQIINLLQSTIQGEKEHNVSEFLRDANQFVLKNNHILNIAPLQVYWSGLLFAPRKSTIRHTFRKEIPASVSIFPDVDETWRVGVQTLEGHSDAVACVAFSPDNKLLASASSEKTIRLWNATTGALLNILEGHQDHVRVLAFSTTGRVLASGAHDNTARLWDPTSGKVLHILEHSKWVSYVAFSPDDHLLASASIDGKIRLWESVTGKLIETIKTNSDRIDAITFSPDCKILSSHWLTLKVWDPATCALEATINNGSSVIPFMSVSPDGRRLAFCLSNNTIGIWDSMTRAPIQTIEANPEDISCLAFSPDSQLLAFASSSSKVQLWDLTTDTLRQTFDGHPLGITSVAFSLDGRMLASSSADGTVRLWDLATCLSQPTHKGHSGEVLSIEFSPKGNILASCSRDSKIMIWDTNTGILKWTLKGHSHAVQSVAFSSDGQLLASGSDDETVRLWDTITGNLKMTLEGHLDGVTKEIFPTVGQLASGSVDKTSRIWDLAAELPRQKTFEGHLKTRSSSDNPALASSPSNVKILVQEDQWLFYQGQRALWIPADYRPGCQAGKDDMIALGHTSGRVIWIRFSAQ